MAQSKPKTEIGSWITRPDEGLTEVMARSNYFDWLCIDMEHSCIDFNGAENLIRIIQNCNLEAFVRIAENDHVVIKRVLDAGANGIIVPMVNSQEDVLKAKDACFYPPIGKRGIGLARAQNYGDDFLNYYSKKQAKTKLIIQIEHIEAVKNIDEILSCNGVYAYFVGPFDLSGSMEIAGQFEHKDFIKAIEKIRQAGIKHKVRSGFHAVWPKKDDVLARINDGYQVLGVSFDMQFMIHSLNNLMQEVVPK